MNKRDEALFKNRTLQLIRSSNRSGSHSGCLKIWKGNTYEHELAKFEICFKLISEGWEIYTETIFLNGSRADIVAIGFGRAVIIEVETKKSEKALKEKMLSKENYPQEFEKVLFITGENPRDLKI